MPIEVRHDVGGPALIAAGLAGAAQRAERDLDRRRQDQARLDQLAQQRNLQQNDIQARARMQAQAADFAMERMAVQGGLTRELQEQRYEHEISRIHETAKAQASQWESRFTAQQRREIARLEGGKQRILGSDTFSEEEKMRAVQAIEMQIAGLQPSLLPKDPNKVEYPEGRGPQDTWVDEKTGALVALDRSGNPRVLVQPEKMPEAVETQRKFDLEQAEMEWRREEEAARRKTRIEFSKLRTEEAGKGGLETTKRYLRPDEVDRMMEGVYGSEERQGNWWERAEEQGLPVAEGDKSLPPEVGFAQAYLRQFPGGYASVPEGKKAAWLEAFTIYSNAVNSVQ